MQCPKCGTNRYTNSRSRRTSQKSLNYRSLCFLICDLLSTKEFLSALLNYQSVRHVNGQDYYADGFHDGNVSKKQIQEMHEIYSQKYQTSSSCIEVSLLLITYYDGVQLFKKMVKPFWPFLISIMNLPPNLRKLYGAGLFTLSLLAVEPGCDCEKFILDLFVQELEMLHAGFQVTISDQDYFVQARAISHVYDTKALEKVLNVQGSNSYSGDPLCRAVPGLVTNSSYLYSVSIVFTYC
jgi:hypothetical protein